MAVEHHNPPSVRQKPFWQFINQLIREHGTPDTTRLRAFADWLQDHDDPRHVIARNAQPVVVNHTRESIIPSRMIRPAGEDSPWFIPDYPVGGEPATMHYKHGTVRLGVIDDPRRYIHWQPGKVYTRPLLIWNQRFPGRGETTLHAPVTNRELHEFIDKLPDGDVKRRWTSVAAANKLLLARMKAPAGGMIVNNQFQVGGQFLAKPMKKIRDAVAAWRSRNGGAQKLSRERTPADPLPGHLEPAMHAAGFDPNVDKKLTHEQIARIADVHGLPHPELRTREDRERFFDKLVASRQPVANIKAQLLDKRADPDLVLAYMVPHLIADSNSYGKNTSWYSGDVDKMERGARHILGKDFPPGSPNQTLLKVLIAATSAGQEPDINVPNAIRMTEEGQLVDPRNPWRHIPPLQEARLRAWLAKQNPIARHVGLTPQEHLNWWLAHDENKLNTADYRAYPAIVSVKRDANGKILKNHPEHDQLVAFEAPKSYELKPGERRGGKNGKLVILPNMGKWLSPDRPRDRRAAAFPVPDGNGEIQAKAWTARDSDILAGKLEDIRHIIDHFGGNMPKVQQWLISDHPRGEFESVVGHPVEDVDEVLAPHEHVPGTFFLGPKFGAFALNLHQNTHPSLGRFLTADVWWTRTWNRFMGTLHDVATGKSQALPRTPRERKLMWAAAKIAAKECGFKSVADLQANLWYHEQHLDRMFGGDAASTSVVDGINRALMQRGHKLRLSRSASSPTRSYWVSPQGEMHEVGMYGHDQFAKQQGEAGVPELQAKGWARVVGAGDMLMTDNTPNPRQARELQSHAIENGYNHVWHTGTDRPLWSRPQDERPEQLARGKSAKPGATLTDKLQTRAEKLKAAGKLLPLGRVMTAMLHAAQTVWGWKRVKLARTPKETIQQFANGHLMQVHQAAERGEDIAASMQDGTAHRVFADLLEEHDDPHHEIVRKSFHRHFDRPLSYHEGRAAAIDKADGLEPGTTPEYAPDAQRVERYAHYRGDGGDTTVRAIRGKKGLAFHVMWYPPNGGLLGTYNAAFTGPEFASLLRRLEPPERTAIIKDLKRYQGPPRPRRLARPVDTRPFHERLRQVYKKTYDEIPYSRYGTGSSADSKYQTVPDHEVFADFLHEHDDPREDIVRNRMGPIKPIDLGGVNDPGRPFFYPSMKVKFDDGTFLTLYRYPKGWNVGWHDKDDAGHASFIKYNTFMGHREFADWVKKFDPETRAKIVEKLIANRSARTKLARPAEPYQIAFVSPSQRENSTFDQAAAGLKSPEMRSLEQDTPGGASGVGLWKDGAEESRLVKPQPGASLDQTAAALGKKYRQKGVVTFRAGAGQDLAHVVVLPGKLDPVTVHDVFMKHGVEYKTIHGNVVHILDPGGSLAPNVQAATKELKARQRSIPGTFRYIGSDDRQSAQRAYDKVLGEQPTPPRTQTDPVALARYGEVLDTRPFHDMVAEPESTIPDFRVNHLNHAPQILADKLDDVGDPRADLIRRNEPDDLWKAVQKLGGTAHNSGPHATAIHILPDRTTLEFMRYRKSKNSPPVWGVVWDQGPDARRNGFRFRAAFKHADFRDWLKRWPIDELKKILHTLRNGGRFGERVDIKHKLARSKRPQPFWQDPAGELHPLGTPDQPYETHQEWADRHNESEETLKAKGWNRIVSDGSTLYVDRDTLRAGELPHRQRAPLINHAIESGHQSLVMDGLRPRPIWEQGL